MTFVIVATFSYGREDYITKILENVSDFFTFRTEIFWEILWTLVALALVSFPMMVCWGG